MSKKIEKAYRILFDEIVETGNLKKYGFTLADFDDARHALAELYKLGEGVAILTPVARFYEKLGFTVRENESGVYYEITC
jgi:hypothetical protein